MIELRDEEAEVFGIYLDLIKDTYMDRGQDDLYTKASVLQTVVYHHKVIPDEFSDVVIDSLVHEGGFVDASESNNRDVPHLVRVLSKTLDNIGH